MFGDEYELEAFALALIDSERQENGYNENEDNE